MTELIDDTSGPLVNVGTPRDPRAAVALARYNERAPIPGMRYQDLGVDFHTQRMDVQRRTRNHVRQLEAMGYTVTLNAAAA